MLRHQSRTIRLTEDAFIDDIAPARTFGFLKEVEWMRQQGLALGGSLENAIVIGDTGVLNNSLRFDDEFVRHKILDVIGDMALVGHPLIGPPRGASRRPRAAHRIRLDGAAGNRRVDARRSADRRARACSRNWRAEGRARGQLKTCFE
jgi:UDP-3-O-acyl-N-acetylglucosamine deacetylase